MKAIAEHGTNFDQIVVLGAEVGWMSAGLPVPRAQAARTKIEYDSLARSKRPVGIALRIGPFQGAFDTNGPVIESLAQTARLLLTEAAAHGVRVGELQLDFDCAESKLEGYGKWVRSIRSAVAPTPVIITALPSWLRQRSFKDLAESTDGFVLQVHSLEKPKGFDQPFTLCDPGAARRAVGKAGEIGVPFRVALPTYGYYVAFDSAGKFIGLAADGPSMKWPAGSRIREVRTDPVEMAGLVNFWSTNRPKTMTGIIWYRMPIESDILNWRFSTLGVVMACRVPQADLKVESRSIEPGVAGVYLRNTGSLDFQSNVAVRVRIHGGRVMASDAIGGFDLEKTGSDSWTFRSAQPFLRAGEERKIGWLRTDGKVEVESERR